MADYFMCRSLFLISHRVYLRACAANATGQGFFDLDKMHGMVARFRALAIAARRDAYIPG